MMFRGLLILAYFCFSCIFVSAASINPIGISGKRFVDTVTGEPFFIKGVDYQPGGSSEVNSAQDPLSDPDTCARDIILFQELGINTVRIYSVNPELNHDECMTMLGMAGIYLILDVNSPLENQHLNRYEPWTTYNQDYLEHVFQVVEQFSGYNNTLGFFAGNEVINDKRSAQYSPPYVKQLIGDMKTYINQHCDRDIPVGYSAADDLKYRVPLSKYLECTDKDGKITNVDFYGVNSYQWCGKQTLESSGYDKLIEAYSDYSKPVFFSEFGCNRVLPRTFDEVKALFSKDMYDVFSGGLVYEFTQEPNNYGLVDIKEDGSATILEDFNQLKNHYKGLALPTKKDFMSAMSKNEQIEQASMSNLPLCSTKYENINIITKVAKDLAKPLIKKGISIEKGHFVDLDPENLKSKYKFYDNAGGELPSLNSMRIVNNFDSSKGSKDKSRKPKKNETNKISIVDSVWLCFAIVYIVYQFV
ncbi:hypothetical protein KAFR_0C01750 [Kazachstania africana CBS 2517]|uniref:1,3-beta-glucanosyltransferase n=1 Tax=Kazachstania africana (strain ATCC 22294 / BCRC 22015 / CBS 2517 / CECT 1963 / NBRC 1671 / NRRL Y-8276) TaxID=1071382 RepID=H2AS18_KAZAF|nr:hypothetical protein KAFR_0C01750 [Kazachstania africana CBS 2517]CCF57168.1 hypothetical protein KAFR_0C01750 [Kazachstania africana CBS 2517]